MKTIFTPKNEAQILSSVKKNAILSEILKSIRTRAEACVNHLCGCK